MSEHLVGWGDSVGCWLLAWAVVVVAVAALGAVFRPRRASVRYGGWLLATFSGLGLLLMVLTVSPVVTWGDIASRWGWPPSTPPGGLVADSFSGVETDVSPRFVSAPAGIVDEPSEVTSAEKQATLGQPIASAAPTTTEPATQAMPVVSKREWSGISASTIFWVWLAGVCFFLGRLARHGWLANRLVGRGLTSISRETKDAYQATCRRLGMVRNVRLAAHDEITTPVCVGAVRPVILWPAADKDCFNRRERDAAMAHEVAHLRRYDEWVNVAAETWRALTWFFPPVHWTIARFRREQEFLCDDLAARELDSAADYAEMLLKLTPVRLGPNVMCFEIGRVFAASSRVRRLLDPKMRCVRPPGRVQTIFLVILGLGLVVGAGSLRLVDFTGQAVAAAESTERDTTAKSGTDGATRPAENSATANPPEKQSSRPQIVEVSPLDGARDVPADTEIRVRFDRPMDPSALCILWNRKSQGGFRPRGSFRYLADTYEFVVPVRLTPGCSHGLTLNEDRHFEEGEYTGFSSVDQVAAEPHSWSFTTAALPDVPNGRRPKVVVVDPPSDSEASLLTLLRVKFDQPMDPTWYGMADPDGVVDKPVLHHFVEYDPESHEFTLPMKLPGNWNGEVELAHFRSADGVEAAPITLAYRTKREAAGPHLLERARVAGQSAELAALIDQIRAARDTLTSVSEEIKFALIFGTRTSWLDRFQCHGAMFKMQGERQFVANVDQIMQIPFRVGSDGTNCWLRRKDELISCSFEELDVRNVLVCDPFGAGRMAATTTMIHDLKLEYLGQVVLDERPCHRIRSWDVKLVTDFTDHLTPVRDWYIDAESLLTVRIEDDGVLHTAFHYKSVNEPISDVEFQPETAQGIEPKAPEPLDTGYTRRFLNVIDGTNGRMSVRWGKMGPKGRSSSGLN
jgi:beta-lactamase regulating signal transducer with metallopeptidase domain